MKLIKNKPWIVIVLLFAFMLVAWSFFITLAVKNQPEEVPLKSSNP